MEESQSSDCLLVIPGEVIYSNIFPYLQLNDLLRLRRVCMQLQLNSSDYIRNHYAFYEQEREINTTNCTFADFIKLDHPASRIYLNNNGPNIFEDPDIPEFLQLYASTITHLRIKHFETCISKPENDFFVALTNLEHLELGFTDARERKIGYTYETVNGVQVPREQCYFPPNFRNLKTLKLGQIEGSDIGDQNYAWDFIDFCPNLEYLQQPLYENRIDGMSFTYKGHHEGPFACVVQTLKQKRDQNLPISLKYYDLQHHEERGFDAFNYCYLLQICYEQNVKLLNVDGEAHDMVNSAFENDYQKFAVPLVSAKNLHFGMLLTELPNLEKLVIESTGNCYYAEVWDAEEDEPQWPKLKHLDITIDTSETDSDVGLGVPEASVTELLSFLFGFVERKGLRDLAIRFDNETARNDLPWPRAGDIISTCDNLTKLTLSNWIGTNKAVSMLWSGLPNLEEVVIDECKTMADVAFVGKRREDPTFLKLTKLRKVSLIGLDSMTKITNLIFSLVFCHLKIKEFHLTSKQPIKSITINGIRSLLIGEFNQYVEKFRFEGWSLHNVSDEEFSQLKREFRASYML